MSPLTAKQQSFLNMMKTNEEFAWKGFQLLLQRPDYIRFFDVLKDAGFFAPASNPAPIPGEQENTIRIPFWTPLRYLKAVAQKAGEQNDVALATKLMLVVRDVSTWHDKNGERRRNYHTNRTFAEILGLVPTTVVTSDDIDLLEFWLNDPFERMLVAHAVDAGVLPKLLNSGEGEDSSKAARVLYHVTAITWRNSGSEREPEPSTVVDDFSLDEILKHHAKHVGVKAGDQAARIMLDRVREVFGTPLRRDYSSLFRPAVEDDAQNYRGRSAENHVIQGLRDVLLGWSAEDPRSSSAVIKIMLRDDLQIIRRVAFYILAQRWTSMSNLYNDIVGPALFAEHSHELYHLLGDRFAEMKPGQQEATVEAIRALPQPVQSDDAERLRRHSQYRWLSSINGKGCESADKWFAELDTDPKIGKLGGHPDFDSYITSGWVGPGPTPYSPDELVALTQANALTDALNKFAPSDDWRGPTTGGLTSSLGDAARARPDVFLANLSQFLSAKPMYQHAVINGLKSAWEAKSEADWERGWEHLTSFFERLSNDEHFWQNAEDTFQHWVVSAIADCLRAGTIQDDHAYDAALLPRTQLIIATLLAREPGAERAADDAMTQAINTFKGRVIEALFSHALREARVADGKHKTHRDVWGAISPIFEAQLAKCKDANYEFSTLCGTYLPQLQYLDTNWTDQQVDQIFPTGYEANTVCALDGLGYASFTAPAYQVLARHGIISRALGLELKGRNARAKLLERIGAAYLWGLEPLNGETFTLLFDTATIDDVEVLIRVFWFVRAQELKPEQRDRILQLWSRTLEWAQQQGKESPRLLSTLSLLATFITTVGDNERRLLEAVAPHVHVGHEAYEFVAQLQRLAPDAPKTITGILQAMVVAHTPEYDYEDRLRSLLEFLASHGERETVIRLSDRLRQLPGIENLFKNLVQR